MKAPLTEQFHLSFEDKGCFFILETIPEKLLGARLLSQRQ